MLRRRLGSGGARSGWWSVYERTGMSFGTRRPRWAMAVWMSASFAAFIAPIVVSGFLTPETDDDWKAMIILLVPVAFGLGYAIKEPPLDEAGMRATRGLRRIRPAFTAFAIGMMLAAPTALIALAVLHFAGGGVGREAGMIALATPLTLGGTAVFLLRVFWPTQPDEMPPPPRRPKGRRF